ncbi:MAG: S8 family peptidase [Crocosphaera sp.]|nr:S8 family peptidase [Crocosphaera sp.]
MNKLDPRLRYLLGKTDRPHFDISESLTSPPPTVTDDRVGVLLRCRGKQTEKDLRRVLRLKGLNINTIVPGFDTVVTGQISLHDLENLKSVEFVAEIESSRRLTQELDISLLETYTKTVHQNLPAIKGEGVIIGIIDSGIDYTHPSFRNEDGSSRILYLWDQRANQNYSATIDLNYGREYTKNDLDKALAHSNPFMLVPHQDKNGHGTHVTGIAAGNGQPDGKFIGIAPKADLIIVALGIEDHTTLGDSQRAVDAFDYIIQKANNRPLAINMSQGMNGGGHSGETLLERAIDSFSRRKSLVIVKSAGNEGGWRTHAGGRISQGQIVELEFVVKANNRQENILELWHFGEDIISIAVQPPGNAPFDFILPENDLDEQNPVGNEIFLAYDLDASETGDTKATLILNRGSGLMLQPGTWKFLLRGDSITHGYYDVWIERSYRGAAGVEQIRFTDVSADENRTISIPGTTKGIITVGSYVTRPNVGISAPNGQISSFSSRGPNRYGLQKPEIVAPGEMIIGSRSQTSKQPFQPNQWHTQIGGTSMAAPHVTGAVALILSLRPDLTGEQIKQILRKTARQDGFAMSAPDNIWGNGKLMVENAINIAKNVSFPQISQVKIEGKTIYWTTDVETTGAIGFHTHQHQLQLGKNLGSRPSLTQKTQHQITLKDLPVGTYYCKIIAFSLDDWFTVDDNDQEFYLIDMN